MNNQPGSLPRLLPLLGPVLGLAVLAALWGGDTVEHVREAGLLMVAIVVALGLIGAVMCMFASWPLAVLGVTLPWLAGGVATFLSTEKVAGVLMAVSGEDKLPLYSAGVSEAQQGRVLAAAVSGGLALTLALSALLRARGDRSFASLAALALLASGLAVGTLGVAAALAHQLGAFASIAAADRWSLAADGASMESVGLLLGGAIAAAGAVALVFTFATGRAGRPLPVLAACPLLLLPPALDAFTLSRAREVAVQLPRGEVPEGIEPVAVEIGAGVRWPTVALVGDRLVRLRPGEVDTTVILLDRRVTGTTLQQLFASAAESGNRSLTLVGLKKVPLESFSSSARPFAPTVAPTALPVSLCGDGSGTKRFALQATTTPQQLVEAALEDACVGP